MILQLSENQNNLLLPSSSEMSAYDQSTISEGVAASVLMGRAGEKMAEIIRNRYVNSSNSKNLKILIVCGPGNNGGDGLVVARLLKKEVAQLQVVRIQSEKYSKENEIEFEKFRNTGNAVLSGKLDATLERAISEADIIVDALLGIGQTKPLRGEILELVKGINKFGKNSKVISLDLPTGINADNGKVYDAHLDAENTITVEFIKRGMLQQPAVKACGQVDTISIGIEAHETSEFALLLGSNLPQFLEREPDSHKGKFGHVLVLGGSKNYPGAPILSSHAALRSGAGLVTYACLSSAQSKNTFPELMLRLLKDRDGSYQASHFSALKRELEQFTCLVIGPGMGRSKPAKEFFVKVLDHIVKSGIPAVIDADGLNLLSEIINSGKSKVKLKLPNCVLTPHPGEMGKLLNLETTEVQEDRYSAVRALSKKLGCVTVLKGSETIVYAGANGFVNLTGNPYMASGGAGDVLSGIIAALMAQGYSPGEAAKLSVYLHGFSADLLLQQNRAPMLASDIIAHIPEAISKLK